MYNNLEVYNQAKEFLEKALVIWQNIFGEVHASVATCYDNMALVYDSLGKYSQARELHEKTLIWKKIFGEDHASVATSYNNLALVYESLAEYSQAKELNEKAMMRYKNVFW